MNKLKFYEVSSDDKERKKLGVVKAFNFNDAARIFQQGGKNIPIRVRKVELEYTDNPKDKITLFWDRKQK